MDFPLTGTRRWRDNPPVMSDVPRLTGLADASDHLWRARHELLSAGYGLWVGDLAELIETIRMEIEWLSHEGNSPEAP